MRQLIRYGLALVPVLIALSTTGARADDWCGYTTHDNAVIECGYTTVAGCESAVGKGGMCFVDPDTALNTKPLAPATAVHRASGRG